MGVSELIKITEEEKIAIDNDFDPIEAPPGPYKVQPDVPGIQENQRTFIFTFLIPGKIIWLSGAPGMGKSTTAQLLARKNGFVYYEADCFMALKNPYIALDVDNPSLASQSQKPLKGRL